MRPLADAATELVEAGVSPSRVVPWLLACGAAVVDDLVVSTQGRPSVVAERVLEARGVAMALEEMAAHLAAARRGVTAETLGETLGPPRFRLLDGERVELAAWASPREATGSAAGGRGRARHQIVERRSGSVRPGADRKAPGLARPTPVAGEAPAGPDGRAWLWVRVDREVLRGAEGAVPVSTVELAGVRPDRRRTFSSRYGPVTLSHDGDQPARGSVRAVALAAGADEGDTLLLGFSAAGDVAVEVHRGSGPQRPPACKGVP